MPALPGLSYIAGLRSLWHHQKRLSSEEEAVCAILHHPQSREREGGQQTGPGAAAKSSASPAPVPQRRVAIVGNGPLADEQRPAIEAADVVIRFNAMHSRWESSLAAWATRGILGHVATPHCMIRFTAGVQARC